jgi:hypothetical protein
MRMTARDRQHKARDAQRGARPGDLLALLAATGAQS